MDFELVAVVLLKWMVMGKKLKVGLSLELIKVLHQKLGELGC